MELTWSTEDKDVMSDWLTKTIEKETFEGNLCCYENN